MGQADGSPAACYREISRFPAITRAALGAAAGGQTFLLYTGESPAGPPRCLWPLGPVRVGSDGPFPQSAAAPTCPAAGPCASAATTACSVPAAAASPSAGQRSAPRSTTSTGCGLGRHCWCPWCGWCPCKSSAHHRPPPTSRSQAAQPGLTHRAAPRRAEPLPAAGPRAAGGNASCPGHGSPRARRGDWSARAAGTAALVCQYADPCPPRCGAAAGAATAWTSRRWGSTGRSTRRVGPLSQQRQGWHSQRPRCQAAPLPGWALAPSCRARALRLPGLVLLGDAAALRG